MSSPPRCCRAASADFATALPTLPPHCRRSPPLSSSLPSLSRAADAVAALPAVAASLPRCLRRSDDAATTLPTLPPRCHRRRRAAAAALPPPSLPPCHPAAPLLVAAELPPLTPRCRCRLRADCFHRATDVLLLPTLPPRCQRRHRAANAAAMLPPPPPLCRRLLPHSPPPLSCSPIRHRSGPRMVPCVRPDGRRSSSNLRAATA